MAPIASPSQVGLKVPGCGMRSSMPESDNETKDRIKPASSMADYYNDNADALFSQYQAMNAATAHASRDIIADWWDQAFADRPRRGQFFLEAQAALPAVGGRFDVQAVFEGLLHQRTRLKANQQLAEWHGLAR